MDIISSNGHYEYPNVPTASHLLSLLQNKIRLNGWEFYQAYKQGVYVFPLNNNKNTYVVDYNINNDNIEISDSHLACGSYKCIDGFIFQDNTNTWFSFNKNLTFNYLGKVVSIGTISISSKKARGAGHYEYPDIPPASYLLSSLQNKIKLNDWEFYQAYKQGVYVFPKKYVNNVIDGSKYYEVKFIDYYNNGNYKAQIVIHFLEDGYLNYQPIKYDSFRDIYGIINDDNNWTASESDDIAKKGQTFDYLGNYVATYMVDSSTTPSTVRIPAPPLTGGGMDINDINNQGWVESINSKKIKGWAANGTTPKAVDIYIDGDSQTNFYSVTPTLVREDVASVLNATNKKFGWTFDIPQTDGNAKEGQHNVKVYFANSQMALSSNIPLFYVVTPPPPPPPPPPTGGNGTGGTTQTGGTRSNLSNTKGDTTTPKQTNLKPILIGLGIVILGLITYKILKKK